MIGFCVQINFTAAYPTTTEVKSDSEQSNVSGIDRLSMSNIPRQVNTAAPQKADLLNRWVFFISVNRR
jgi:hypothetical protein